MVNSRAKAIDNAVGLVKILAEKETDKSLGVHVMSPNTGELIHEAVLACSTERQERTYDNHATLNGHE
ncbi:hypothetical protein RND81_09G198300 [Saponaria officinalis]|uniref:Pyridine nucleotide-disulphide oxidoreductase dimerisation domain-containing protein n=1 Tax=Saponaria officinalis TaxID=3572 RepID=A0AAW1IP24_SAPOF